MSQNGLAFSRPNRGAGTTIIHKGNLTDPATFTSADARNYFNKSGILKSIAANEPRITYPDGDLAYSWYDGGVTNSLLHNRDLSQTTWTNNGATQDATGIDGAATTAWTFSGTDDASQAVTVANDSNTHRPTWMLEKNGGTAILSAAFTGGTTTLNYVATVDTSDGSATASGDAVAADISVVDVGSWYWVKLDAANNSTGNTTLTYNMDVSAGTFVYDFGGVFLNQEAPLHPFETGASAITLDSEDASLALGSWYNNTKGSVLLEMWFPTVTSDGTRWLIDFRTDVDNRKSVYRNAFGDIGFQVRAGGVTQLNVSTPNAKSAQLQKIAFVWDGNNFRLTVDGTQTNSGTGTNPSVTDVYIGSLAATSHAYAGYASVTFYPEAWDQTEAESRTT